LGKARLKGKIVIIESPVTIPVAIDHLPETSVLESRRAKGGIVYVIEPEVHPPHVDNHALGKDDNKSNL